MGECTHLRGGLGQEWQGRLLEGGAGAAENREIAEGGIEVQGPASFLFSLLKMMGVVTFLPEAPVWV